jgi:hypothetical protein
MHDCGGYEEFILLGWILSAEPTTTVWVKSIAYNLLFQSFDVGVSHVHRLLALFWDSVGLASSLKV